MSVNGAPHPAAVAFEGVSFSYGGAPVVEDVTFRIEPGEFFALVGPNGSGKTTLVRLALGLLRPQRGAVRLFGQEVPRFARWRDVGYVPQTASGLQVGFPATVAEVAAYGEYRGLDPRALLRRGTSPRVEAMLKLVGMWEHRHRPIGRLSTGQQQRVLIARALVRRPRLLFLDEPTAGVDVGGQEQFYDLLRHLNRDEHMTIVLVSHDVGVVLHEATRIGCINRRLVFHGRPEDVTNDDLSRLYGFSVDLVVHRHS